MPLRPPSSAGQTSTSDRPPTARPTTASYLGHDPQYTYSQEYTIDEDEDEESEAEDVFAFGPPSTADQQLEAEQQLQNSHDHSVAAAPISSFRTLPLVSPISIPPPTLDLYSRARVGPIPGPSSLQPRHPYPYPLTPPADSPPSTDSQSHDGDPFRLRRLTQPASIPASSPATGTGTGRLSGVSSAVDSREVHVSLPASKSSRVTPKRASSIAGAKEPPSTPGSLSFNSMFDIDSEDASIKMEVDLDELEDGDSPYPEVRASVSNIDDPDMPVLTIRMWFLGLLLLCIGGSANLFFFMRQPAPVISPGLMILISYPLGKFMAYILPITTYRLPRFLGGAEFSLNPGPWNIKEHALIYMMANVALGTPYALQATITANDDYSFHLDYWFNVVMVLATQLTGFGLAGLCRRFLVWPASMIWPANLITCTFLNTLHAEEDVDRGGTSKYKYFMYVGIGAFIFFWLPGYMFTAISVFSWVCWIVPDNIPVNQLFGVSSGLGLSFITFDWTEISWIGSPLMTPWWAQVQIFGGFVVFYWIIGPALYYTNAWDLSYFPMLTQSLFDRFGQTYNISRVLDQEHKLNQTAYDSYSPLFMPLSYAMNYLLTFALSSCVFVHTLLYNGNMIITGIRNKVVEKDDIHAKLMRAYPEVPDWWYASVFVICFSLAIVANEVWNTGAPVWSLLLAVILPTAYIVPSGLLLSMTGQGINMNLLAQIIPGMLLPGQPVANMMFKAFSLQSLSEGTRFVQDLKLAHYIKVPPRAAFIVQLVATLVVPFIQLGVKQWMFDTIPGICMPGQKDLLTCPVTHVFYSASILWGLIGPSRQFGTKSIYHPQLYAIAVGAFLPVPLWLWQRRYPNTWIKFIHTPLILTSVLAIPPATGMNYSSWFVFGFIFQYMIRRRNFAWWSKFNYVTSAALDTGTLCSVLIIFFTLGIPKNGIYFRWWGNTVYQNTADYHNLPLRGTPPGGIP